MPREMPGTLLTRKRTTSSIRKKGMIRLLMLSRVVPYSRAMPWATNRFTAMGGVIMPMDVLTTMMMPRRRGSSPMVWAMGSRMLIRVSRQRQNRRIGWI